MPAERPNFNSDSFAFFEKRNMQDSAPIGKKLDSSLVRRDEPILVQQTDLVKVYAVGNPDELSKATEAIAQSVGPDIDYLDNVFGVNPTYPRPPYEVYVVRSPGFSVDGSTLDKEGASHFGCGNKTIYVSLPESAEELALGYTAAEMVEVYEAESNSDLDCLRSKGEALSLILAGEMHEDFNPYLNSIVSVWLAGGGCDSISTNDAGDRDLEGNGGSVAFLDWLNSGLGYSWNEIVQAGGDSLSETYNRLTGEDSGMAFERFMAALPSFKNGRFNDAIDPFVNGSQLVLPENGHFSCVSEENSVPSGWSTSTKENHGPLIGGVMGGVGGLLALGAVVFYLQRREARVRSRSRSRSRRRRRHRHN